jgi:transposase
VRRWPWRRRGSDGGDREQRDRIEKEVRDLKKERDALERERDALQRQRDQLEKRTRELQEEIKKLRALLDTAQRAAKRQAAHFSKGSPKTNPKPPGRRAGEGYGVKAHRPVPERWDEELEAELPCNCDCGGDIEELDVAPQYQTDIPQIQPRVTRINVHTGRCRRCGKRVQGRHPRQVSDALGAAASSLGPNALALAAYLNKGLGMPFGKLSALYETHFSLSVTPGGLCLALHRVRRALTPTYEAIVLFVRSSAYVVPDETGWKVGGRLWWLWVFATPTATVYAILPGRGFEQAASVLGEDYAGRLTRDGWGAYPLFESASHQTCLNHISNRCHRMLEVAQRGAARVPHAILSIVRAAFALRDRRDEDRISPHGLAVATGRLSAPMDRLLEWKPSEDSNRRLLDHLRKERDRNALFRFLREPQVDGTNWRGEQAVRPAVVTRKICGGNRKDEGRKTQQTIGTVLRTCTQRALDFCAIVTEALRSPVPRLIDSIAGNQSSSGPDPPR